MKTHRCTENYQQAPEQAITDCPTSQTLRQETFRRLAFLSKAPPAENFSKPHMFGDVSTAQGPRFKIDRFFDTQWLPGCGTG